MRPSQANPKTQIFCTKTYNHDAFCTKTYKYLKIFTKKYQSGDPLYENSISTYSLVESIVYISRHQLHENMQRITDLFQNTNIPYEKVQARCLLYENVHSKSIRKSTSQDAICTKTCFNLQNLYESMFIRRSAVRKHAARHRPVRKHIMYENV